MAKMTPLARHQFTVFVLTFLTYTCFHLSRKPYSIVKNTLDPHHHQPGGWPPFNQHGHDLHSGKTLLGILDSVFLSTYAVCMFKSGHLADRVNLRWLLVVGLLGSAVSLAAFGAAYYFHIHNFGYFVVVNIVGGMFQSVGWPCVVTVMGSWFGRGRRGLVMGIWNSHTSVGNILGALVATASVDAGMDHGDWPLAFFVVAAILVVMAVVNAVFLVPRPRDVGMILPVPAPTSVDGTLYATPQRPAERKGQNAGPTPHVHMPGPADNMASPPPGRGGDVLRHGAASPMPAAIVGDGEDEEAAISFADALRIPGVITMACTLFFSKLVAYSFLYWLPFYLGHIGFSSSRAGYLSTFFDVGGIVGGVGAGILSDKLHAHALPAAICTVLSIPTLFAFYRYSWHVGTHHEVPMIALLATAGCFVNGVYALITTAVSADLGTHPSLSAANGSGGGGRIPDNTDSDSGDAPAAANALATVTGFIDGMGSLGAAVQGVAIGWLSSRLSWAAVFYLLMACNGVATLCMWRMLHREALELCGGGSQKSVRHAGLVDSSLLLADEAPIM